MTLLAVVVLVWLAQLAPPAPGCAAWEALPADTGAQARARAVGLCWTDEGIVYCQEVP